MKLNKILFNPPAGISVHIILLLLRICSGSFLMTHGIPKLNRLMEGGEIKFSDPIGLGPEASLVLAVFAEVICAALIILGFGTRVAGFILVIFMSVISFIVHNPDPFGRKELPLLYLLFFLATVILGGGKFSVDGLIGKGINRGLKNN